MRSNQTHVECAILGKGMFPNEVAVKVEVVNSEPVTALVDRSLLQSSGSKHFLIASMIKSEENISVCLLPIEVESGSRWVRVKNSALLDNPRELQLA